MRLWGRVAAWSEMDKQHMVNRDMPQNKVREAKSLGVGGVGSGKSKRGREYQKEIGAFLTKRGGGARRGKKAGKGKN